MLTGSNHAAAARGRQWIPGFIDNSLMQLQDAQTFLAIAKTDGTNK
ncbi:hypothetical protein [Nitrosomonas sp. wSCUT-2]